MNEQRYSLLFSAPFIKGSQDNNAGQLSEEIRSILDFYRSGFFAEEPMCEDRTPPTEDRYEKLLTNLVDKTDYPLERRVEELKTRYPAPTVFALKRVYPLMTPCTINGDAYTRIEVVVPDALKHYREYFTAKGLPGFEAAFEKAIRYIVGSLCGHTLVPLPEDARIGRERSYQVRSIEKDGTITQNIVPELVYGTSSQGLLVVPGIPAIQPNRESRFHLRPREGTIFFYHLLELAKPRWTQGRRAEGSPGGGQSGGLYRTDSLGDGGVERGRS